MKYKFVMLGGTFDHLHQGHKELLSRAFELSQQVIIGLTSDEFASGKKFNLNLESYDQRKKNLIEYLDNEFDASRYELVEISDVLGTTLTDDRVQALVVSRETLSGADIVNQARVEHDLEALAVEEVDLVLDQDQTKLASYRIRSGFVSDQGEVYSRLFRQDLILDTDSLKELKTPMGQVMQLDQIREAIDDYRPVYLSVVGDVTFNLFQESGINMNLAVFDGKTQREPVDHIVLPDWKLFKSQNQAGSIQSRAVETLISALGINQALVKVKGEEDLLALPLVLLQPLHSLVCYGQPNEGVVMVEVDQETKSKWYRFIQKAGKI